MSIDSSDRDCVANGIYVRHFHYDRYFAQQLGFDYFLAPGRRGLSHFPFLSPESIADVREKGEIGCDVNGK